MYSDGGAVGTPSVRYAGLCTVGWVYCGVSEGTLGVHCAGLCPVGWVYCGVSEGTLGVHYAGLSVLWDGCIVMEGRMEHWVYTMLD